ncbi:MAG: DUF4174 domain-containing protein [Pseudomonadota bacterium]
MRQARRLVIWARLALVGVSFFGAIDMAHADGLLDAYRWQNRLIVVFADQDSKKEMEQQHHMLLTSRRGLLDRHLVIVEVDQGLVTFDGLISQSVGGNELRDVLNVSRSGFSVVLIGKDGGVKMRSTEPTTSASLFALIDAMPMRQREMKEQQTDRR